MSDCTAHTEPCYCEKCMSQRKYLKNFRGVPPLDVKPPGDDPPSILVQIKLKVFPEVAHISDVTDQMLLDRLDYWASRCCVK